MRERRRTPGGDIDFLLGLLDELQREVGLFAATSSTRREFAEAAEEAALREVEELRQRVAQLEGALRAAGQPVPPVPRSSTAS